MKPFDLDYDTYKNPIERKTYISPSIENGFDNPVAIRIVTRGIDQSESYEMAEEKGELLLRATPGGKNIITAKVIEKSNQIYVLNIQEYTASTGNPHKKSFAFIGEEITKLFNFIRDVQTMRFGSERYQRLNDEDIKAIELTDSQTSSFFKTNPKLFTSIIQSQITTQDIIAFGYRKKQLEFFDKFLNEANYFEQLIRDKKIGREAIWQ